MIYRDDDPPDYPEVPECCDEEMEVDSAGGCKCLTCGKTWDPPKEWDPGPEPDVELPDDFFEGPPMCPRGSPWTACDHCDHLSDLAYDAARERR